MTTSIHGTTGVTFPDASVQATAATGFGFKNRIINGAMVIDQRNAGASVTQSTSATYTVDRWVCYGTAGSKFTVQQNAGSVTLPEGFTNYLGCTSSSAYSIGSGDLFFVSQRIEGFNIADLGWGSANAKSVTLSFQVYSSLTGTFGGAIRSGTGNASYPFTYTVSSANTWTTVNVTIAGPTSGGTAEYPVNNGIGLAVVFSLGAGSSYSGTAGSWTGNCYSATGATSVVGTNGATFYITGVQLEKGSTATSFDYRPYGTELALCQRYYWRSAGNSSGSGFNSLGTGYASSTSTASIMLPLPVSMRATPTLNFSGSISFLPATTGTSVASISVSYSGNSSVWAVLNGTASGLYSQGPALIYTQNASTNWFDASAEL